MYENVFLINGWEDGSNNDLRGQIKHSCWCPWPLSHKQICGFYTSLPSSIAHTAGEFSDPVPSKMFSSLVWMVLVKGGVEVDLSHYFPKFPPSTDKNVFADCSWSWLQPFYAIFMFPLVVPQHVPALETPLLREHTADKPTLSIMEPEGL